MAGVIDHPPATPEVDQSNKVIDVPESISHANRQFDLVVGSLDPGIGDLVRYSCDNRIHSIGNPTYPTRP